jgi:hypothetical protein
MVCCCSAAPRAAERWQTGVAVTVRLTGGAFARAPPPHNDGAGAEGDSPPPPPPVVPGAPLVVRRAARGRLARPPSRSCAYA